MTTFRKECHIKSLRRGESGSVLMEAALVMPMLILLVAGITDYGLTLYQYHTLSTANGAAVRQLIVSRGFENPYASVLAQYAMWAPILSVQGSQITVSVADSAGTLTACTDSTSPSCKSLLDGAAGKQAKIEVDYPCIVTFIPSMNGPCPIRISASGMVE